MLSVSVAQLQLAVAQGLSLGPVTVLDSAATIAANLDLLQTWNADGLIGSVQFTDPTLPKISLSYEQYQADLPLIGLFQGSYAIAIADRVSVDVALDLLAVPTITYVQIGDTGANVTAALDTLVDLAPRLSIFLTEGLVSLTYDQFQHDRAILPLLSKSASAPYWLPQPITPTYTISDTLSIAQALSVIFTDNHVTGLHVVDSANHFDRGLYDAVSYTRFGIHGFTQAGAIDFGRIEFTDAATPVVHLSPSDMQFWTRPGDGYLEVAQKEVLGAIDLPFDLVIDHVTVAQAAQFSSYLDLGSTARFDIVDKAANILASLDTLTQYALDNHLASITVTDVPPSSLSFTPAQWAVNYAAIARFSPNRPATGAVTVSLQDDAVGTVDAPYHYVPGLGFAINGHVYVATPLSSQPSSFLDVTKAFGLGARLADWRDLETDLTTPELVQAFLTSVGLPVETPYGTYPNLYVSYASSGLPNSGTLYYGGNRFFITNFTGSSPAAVDYGVIDSIGPLVLGAYNWPGQSLVRIDGNAVGATTPGHVLSAGNNLVDPDGMGAVAYQWQANGADIDGATGLSLTLGEDLIGKVVTVVAHYVDGLGTPESVSSAGVLVIGDTNSRPGLGPSVSIALARDTGQFDHVTSDAMLIGTSSAGLVVTVREGGQVLASLMPTGPTTGSWNVALSAFADGIHVITVDQTDANGRTGSAELTFTLDRTPPGAPVLHLPARTANGLITVAGKAEAGATVTLYRDGTLLGTTTADVAGQFSFDPTAALADGRHLFTATASDLAGNLSALSRAASTFAGSGPSPGNAYVYVAAPHITFDAALAQAMLYSLDGVTGHLLTIESASEQAALASWFGTTTGETPVWLGMTDAGTEGVWRFAAGPQTGSLVAFAAWATGEPNNWAGNEDQATFTPAGWNDYDGTDPNGAIKGFVVEFENATNSPSSDAFVGTPGDNRIDGGGGHDTLLVGASSRHFTIAVSADSVTLTDKVGTDGIDTLHGVETMRFADLTLDTAWFTAAASLPQAQFGPLIEMYIAYFNRAPDAVGLDYWASALAGGMSLPEIAASFFVQPETMAQYPAAQSIEVFVDAVYHNVLGRAPDAAGMAYWTNELIKGTVSQPTFLLAIINGAKSATGGAADAQYIADKQQIGAHFALTAGLNNADQARAVMDLFDGSAASVTAANHLTDTYLASALTPGSSDLVVQLVGLPA